MRGLDDPQNIMKIGLFLRNLHLKMDVVFIQEYNLSGQSILNFGSQL